MIVTVRSFLHQQASWFRTRLNTFMQPNLGCCWKGQTYSSASKNNINTCVKIWSYLDQATRGTRTAIWNGSLDLCWVKGQQNYNSNPDQRTNVGCTATPTLLNNFIYICLVRTTLVYLWSTHLCLENLCSSTPCAKGTNLLTYFNVVVWVWELLLINK